MLNIDLSYFNWYGYDLTNPKKLKKLINKLERLIRLAPEYTTWANICRAGIYQCPRCNTPSELMPLEVHHTPKTLFEIVEEILNKYIEDDTILDKKPYDIVKEVLDLHLNNNVGYEVICKACHEMIHNENKRKKKIKDYDL